MTDQEHGGLAGLPWRSWRTRRARYSNTRITLRETEESLCYFLHFKDYLLISLIIYLIL